MEEETHITASAYRDPRWIIAFSGHRPEKSHSRSRSELLACHQALRTVLGVLKGRAELRNGTIELLTGVAAGADVLAGEVASDLGIPVHVMLPLPELLFERDFAGHLASDWPRAQRLIVAARRGERGGTFRRAKGDLTRPDCYREANVQMLEMCDVLVAICTPRASMKLGGTMEVIEQADGAKLPTVRIDPANGTTTDWFDGATSWPTGFPFGAHDKL